MRLQNNGILGVLVNNDLPLGSVCKLDARLVVPFVVVAVAVFCWCCYCWCCWGSRVAAVARRQRKYLICETFQAESRRVCWPLTYFLPSHPVLPLLLLLWVCVYVWVCLCSIFISIFAIWLWANCCVLFFNGECLRAHSTIMSKLIEVTIAEQRLATLSSGRHRPLSYGILIILCIRLNWASSL